MVVVGRRQLTVTCRRRLETVWLAESSAELKLLVEEFLFALLLVSR